jgi:hypothetical protein
MRAELEELGHNFTASTMGTGFDSKASKFLKHKTPNKEEIKINTFSSLRNLFPVQKYLRHCKLEKSLYPTKHKAPVHPYAPSGRAHPWNDLPGEAN